MLEQWEGDERGREENVGEDSFVCASILSPGRNRQAYPEAVTGYQFRAAAVVMGPASNTASPAGAGNRCR